MEDEKVVNVNDIVASDVIEACIVYLEKNKLNKMENRRSFGFSFAISGRVTYEHKGKKYTSDESHAVFLPEGENYSIFCEKEGYFPVINFESVSKFTSEITVIEIPDKQTMINLFEQIKHLILFEKSRAEKLSIFYEILKNIGIQKTENSIVYPAIKYIEDNYCEKEITNKTLADICFISEIYLRKSFIREVNKTPKQYIIDIRIEKAKQLLSEGIYKSNAVSEKCGFANPYHFCRTFKKRVGITPMQYSKQQRNIKI